MHSNNAVYSRCFDIFTLHCSRSWSFYKTKVTRPRPRSRPEWQDQDQERASVPRLFVQYTYCSSSKQFPFSVLKRLLYLTYSKFDITALTISTTELHEYSLRINAPHILQRIRIRCLRVGHFCYPTRTRTRWCLPVPDPDQKSLPDPRVYPYP